MFGSHLSIAGGLHNALLEGKRLEMDCVQVFTASPRNWPKPSKTANPDECGLPRESIDLWRRHAGETRISDVVSHDSYLINLAHPEEKAWQKSIAAFRAEMLRCEALGIPSVVTHPGAHLGSGEPAGLTRVAAALDQLHRELPGYKVVTLLEVTAGQGSCLGAKFEEIARIIEQVRDASRVAVCLDTAHMLEAGYDLTSRAGAEATVAELDRVISLKLVRAIHLNDSKTPRGSRVDRHEHIGKGHVSLDAFRVVVNTPAFANVPKVLETPKDKAPDGRDWDTVNLAVLKGLQTVPRAGKTVERRSSKTRR